MIKDLFHTNRPTYSLEVFPQKKDADVSVISDALDEFKTLHPSFISVTYGAGGNTAENTFAIASYIQNQMCIRDRDMHIKTLRKKLGEAGERIHTVRNVGYRLE